MRRIFGSIVKDKVSCGKCLIYEAIVDTMRVYIYICGDDLYEGLNVEFEQMVEEKDGSGEAKYRRGNLEETHKKMRENVKSKLANYLHPLLEVPSSYNWHWWPTLIIDPGYVN